MGECRSYVARKLHSLELAKGKVNINVVDDHDDVADGPKQWGPSMGMRHPDRPCMDRARNPGGCGLDTRSPDEKASDPYDCNNNPVCLAESHKVAAEEMELLSPEEQRRRSEKLQQEMIGNIK